MEKQLTALVAQWEEKQKKIEHHLDNASVLCSFTAAHNRCIANTYKQCIKEIRELINQNDSRN